jgi:site-specific DNA-methyltransferase (cytosine-N4-specific)
VEASLAGSPSVGIDLNPLACLISRVKVTPLRASLSEAAESAIRRSSAQEAAAPPVIPALDHWFRPDIQRAISALLTGIAGEAACDVRDALKVALSSIIVRVSNQESDTRYAAVEKPVEATDVVGLFRRAARVLDQALRTTWPPLFRPPPVRVLNRNVLKVRPGEIGRPVSLVVSSPPYPNAYEYWLYHKYRMYWLGMDPIAVRQQEIGARPHYFKRNPHTPADFERQMGEVFALLSAVIVPGGHACFQVGSSLIRGQIIDNAALLSRAASLHGFHLAAMMKRDIPGTRKAFNLHHARIKEERVLVFRLEK